MKKNFLIFAVAILVLVFGAFAAQAYAYGGWKGEGPQGCFEGKFCHKVQFIMENSDELGLSDKQLEDIKALKVAAKKDMIRKKAEIDILAVDLESELHKDTIDKGVVNALIDKKYDLKKDLKKALVGAYADLKNILTPEQKNKMKELWHAQKREMPCMMGGMGKMGGMKEAMKGKLGPREGK